MISSYMSTLMVNERSLNCVRSSSHSRSRAHTRGQRHFHLNNYLLCVVCCLFVCVCIWVSECASAHALSFSLSQWDVATIHIGRGTGIVSLFLSTYTPRALTHTEFCLILNGTYWIFKLLVCTKCAMYRVVEYELYYYHYFAQRWMLWTYYLFILHQFFLLFRRVPSFIRINKRHRKKWQRISNDWEI